MANKDLIQHKINSEEERREKLKVQRLLEQMRAETIKQVWQLLKDGLVCPCPLASTVILVRKKDRRGMFCYM